MILKDKKAKDSNKIMKLPLLIIQK